MEILYQYISSLFAAMPDTENRIELEDELRREATERYEALRATGHSEAEAIGLVLPHINKDEIRRRLESDPGRQDFGYQRSEAEVAEIEQTIAEYNHFRPRFGVAMAIGVLLIVVGIVLAVWFGVRYEDTAYVIVGFFVPVAVAVFIFIIFGMRHAAFMSFFRAKEIYDYLSPEMAEKLRCQKMRYREYANERRFREWD